jgi:hypothetical protein
VKGIASLPVYTWLESPEDELQLSYSFFSVLARLVYALGRVVHIIISSLTARLPGVICSNTHIIHNIRRGVILII